MTSQFLEGTTDLVRKYKKRESARRKEAEKECGMCWISCRIEPQSRPIWCRFNITLNWSLHISYSVVSLSLQLVLFLWILGPKKTVRAIVQVEGTILFR